MATADASTTVVRCANCGANNRVDAGKVAQGFAAVCARCKAPLDGAGAGGSHPVEVTEGTFGEVVERSGVPVLVDLWAPWCGPCRMIAPVLEKLAGEFAGRAKVVKVNVDENPGLAARFRADAIPLLVIVKGGREVDRMVGVQPGPEIARRLAQAVGA
ncbi:MAG: thioredoxin [Phycisphaerae bacterium]